MVGGRGFNIFFEGVYMSVEYNELYSNKPCQRVKIAVKGEEQNKDLIKISNVFSMHAVAAALINGG